MDSKQIYFTKVDRFITDGLMQICRKLPLFFIHKMEVDNLLVQYSDEISVLEI